MYNTKVIECLTLFPYSMEVSRKMIGMGKCFEITCFQRGCDICVEALATSVGSIQMCSLGMPYDQTWTESREEKKCFSEPTQQTMENLEHIYIYILISISYNGKLLIKLYSVLKYKFPKIISAQI